jgi:hypothetical protein
MFRKITFILLFLPFFIKAQNLQRIKGLVLNDFKEPLAQAKVQIVGSNNLIFTDQNGAFELKLKPGNYIISVGLLGYKTINSSVKLLAGKDEILAINLPQEVRNLAQVVVQDQLSRTDGMIKFDPRIASQNPNISQNFESILKQLPGVSTNNELSAQYSVRGGNFDENLIYINDVEIYKPYLIRNGQQEGLSLINPDLVGEVKFSAGGFTPRYGDKLSSVLDVKYKTSDTTKYIAGIGTNGLSFTSFFKHKKWSGAVGFRNKQNKFILNKQPVLGSYQPEFYDLQTQLNFQLNSKTNIAFLGIYNSSKFGLVPESRVTEFGTFNEILRLSVNYEGQEKDQYNNLVSSLSINHQFNKKFHLKWVNSVFFITEKENFDILGSYVFDEIENDFANQNFGKVKANRGIGAYQNYGRNELIADVYASEMKLNLTTKKSFWETGFRFQFDQIKDQLNEFELRDSAGYSIPNNFNNFTLSQSVSAENEVKTLRYAAYAQNTAVISSKISYSGGIRFNYNDFTKEFIISPRLSFVFQPKENKNHVYKFAAGIYTQPPFYREARNFDGQINPHIKAQKSIHFVLSSDHQFEALGTTLKFTSEAYYKHLSNLTPYQIENLRVRYYANEQSNGYAAGLDFRINGEFVKDLESSFRLSIMKTAEDIKNDSYTYKDENGNTQIIYPGYLKRPTDQRVNFSAFFQDKLFRSPTYKVHMNLLYGSRLPTSPPGLNRSMQKFTIPAYKRLDIGFSKDILDAESLHKPALLAKYFKSIIFYAEVFNLLNINNTVSYLWITDVNNYKYAIPNYLTSRQLNVRLITKF